MPRNHPIRRVRPFALLAPLALLAACSTQPPYERPAMEVPEAFKEGVAGSGVWQAAQPMDSVPDAWWTLFN
ncbi:MAG: RND transporter, partial [Burkholderiaceae bacterium]